MTAKAASCEEYGCPLWDADGDPTDMTDVAHSWGIFDATKLILEIPLRDGLEHIVVAQRLGLEGSSLSTARYVWKAAVMLCNFFSHCMTSEDGADHPIKAVEVGAGTGICAVALARCLGGSCEVVATDLAMALPLLRDSVARNMLEASVSCQELDWEQPQGSPTLMQAHLVFGSDLLDLQCGLPLLFKLMRTACQNGAMVVLAYEHRISKREIHAALTDGLSSTDGNIPWVELRNGCWNDSGIALDPVDDNLSIYIMGDLAAHVSTEGPLGRLSKLVQKCMAFPEACQNASRSNGA
ncbi:unnamed protein product [Polarella glacialis]|uniref:Calmodulin-lysine N-methyltransferase n=1 Tax=Polarella glacialis TaxID=89957 RepID=A0A813L4G3_POLGL|nr:unnamed protein product [Polarella glacialis]